MSSQVAWAISMSDKIVAEAWGRVLGVPAQRGDRLADVLANDGGMVQARQVARLLQEINAASGVQLPLTVTYLSPTPAELSEMIRTQDCPRYERPLLMRQGTGRPLFIFPGAGGLGLDLISLAKHLVIPGAVYLNPPRGVDGAKPDRTMHDQVADHIDAIRTVQPHGPYSLLGYSWGGLVALEIARFLQASGEKIVFLGMIEPVLHELDWTLAAWIEYLAKRTRHHLVHLRRTATTPGAALRYGRGLLTPVIGRVGRRFGFNQWTPLTADIHNWPAPLDEVYKADIDAINAHRVGRYNGKVTIFAALSGHAAMCNPVKVWRTKANPLELIWLQGDHFSILCEPDVRNTAAIVSTSIVKGDLA